MKHMKKVMALLLAMVMVLAMSVTAFADDTTSTGKTITLTGGKKGHTYTAYQIFTGTVNSTTGELTGIQWGTDAPAALKNAYSTAAAAAKAVSAMDGRAFAQAYAADLTTGGKAVSLTADGNVVFSGLASGYYVITDTVASGATVNETGDFYSTYIVKLTNDVNGAIKGEAPSSQKKIADNNDSESVQPALEDIADTAWQDSADYDIGDAVPFQLKATTASNVDKYKKYHITFRDTYSAGFDAPTSFNINVLGKDITYSGSETNTTTDNTKITVSPVTESTALSFAFKVTFEPLNGSAENPYLNAECDSIDITVEYTQTLNSNAVLGQKGNPNTSYIQYSSNPESEDDSEEGETPKDTVIAFTYKVIVNKTDETGTALADAAFKLYKEVPQGTDGAETGATIKASFGTNVSAAALGNDKYYVEATAATTDSADDPTVFTFTGIDDGTYVLVETTIPEGYNAWAATAFTVTATHTTSADIDPATGKVDGEDAYVLTALSGGDLFTGDLGKVTLTPEKAELETTIKNNSGAVLPETGGIGTTLFYVIGAVLVIGAGIVLVTRRRMSAK